MSRADRNIEVGNSWFILFPNRTYRWLRESSLGCIWRPELDGEWQENLAAINQCKPLLADDARKLGDAQDWLDSKGDDE